MRKKSVRIQNTNISYLDSGKGQVVVFLAGLTYGVEREYHLTRALSENFRVIAPDITALRAGRPSSIDGLAQLLAKFITKLKLRSVTLVGHSTGGAVALSYATHYKKAQSVVLLNPVLPNNTSRTKLVYRMFFGPNTLDETIPVAYRSSTIHLLTHFGRVVIRTPLLHLKLLREVTSYTHTGIKLNVPLLIIHGVSDELFHWDHSFEKEFKTLSPRVRVQLLIYSHMWPLFYPQRAKQLIEENESFLKLKIKKKKSKR